MKKEDLITLTADIVAAHVSYNKMPMEGIGELIANTFKALSTLGEPIEPDRIEKSPVVSVRASIKEDYLVCMECGAKQKTLRRHLKVAHNMSPVMYREDYGLPSTYPMTAPSYSKSRSELAKNFGLGRKRKASDLSSGNEQAGVE